MLTATITREELEIVPTERPPAPLPLTVVFTDIEGSSAILERLGDCRWMKVLRAHNDVVREQVRRHGGAEIKRCGDGFLLAFGAPQSAVRCAEAIQRSMHATVTRAHERGLSVRVRVGIHTGRVVVDDGDLVGHAVVLAARITASGRGGEIVVSDAVRARCPDVAYAEERLERFKGLAAVHRVHVVDWAASTPGRGAASTAGSEAEQAG